MAMAMAMAMAIAMAIATAIAMAIAAAGPTNLVQQRREDVGAARRWDDPEHGRLASWP
jgi:hypothetical protein